MGVILFLIFFFLVVLFVICYYIVKQKEKGIDRENSIQEDDNLLEVIYPDDIEEDEIYGE